MPEQRGENNPLFKDSIEKDQESRQEFLDAQAVEARITNLRTLIARAQESMTKFESLDSVKSEQLESWQSKIAEWQKELTMLTDSSGSETV